jgi:hypothetical protein
LDQSYGDVIVKNPGIFRLLEFKREASRSKKEAAKLVNLEVGLGSSAFSSSETEQLKTISRKVHWYVEIPSQQSLLGNVRVVPYLDFKQSSGHIDLATFVKDIANEASSISKTEEDMRQSEWYLSVLCECVGSTSAALLGRVLN